MSIVRIGLGETQGFSDGYDRIFGKKTEEKPTTPPATSEGAAPPEKKEGCGGGGCGTGGTCGTKKSESAE
ncbi:MAG: hypothetical protein R3B84_03605 [Zavarzinella sp.]